MFRQIQMKDELIRYQKICEELLEIQFPMAYLLNCKIYVYEIFNSECQSVWLAGFLVKSNLPFRTLDAMPEPEILTHNYSVSEMAEVNALWIASSKMRAQLTLLTLHEVGNIVRNLDKKYALYCYDKSEAGLGRLYSKADSLLIYSGPTFPQEGMLSATEENIELIEAVTLPERIEARFRFQPDQIRLRIVP